MVFALLGLIQPAAEALVQELIDVAAILNALRTGRPAALETPAWRSSSPVLNPEPAVVVSRALMKRRAARARLRRRRDRLARGSAAFDWYRVRSGARGPLPRHLARQRARWHSV